MVDMLVAAVVGYLVGAAVIPLPKVTQFVLNLWSKLFSKVTNKTTTSNTPTAAVKPTTTTKN